MTTNRPEFPKGLANLAAICYKGYCLVSTGRRFHTAVARALMKKVIKRQERTAASAKRRPTKPAPRSQPDPAKSGKTPSAALATPGPDRKRQTELFEEAARLFHTGDYAKARSVFQQVCAGPGRHMAHAARLHVNMCDKRLEKSQHRPETPEDRYNYAVSLINLRQLEAAEEQLRQALAQVSDADHIHYALALTRGLRGDLEGSYVHLKRAIELQPKNRTLARNDPDFSEFARRSPVRDLL